MTSRRQALLALALLLTLVLSVLFGVIAPLAERYIRDRERIAELDDRITRLQTVAATRADVEADIATIRRTMRANEAAFFASKPPTVAAAELQRTLKFLAETHGATIISSQPLDVDTSERYARVTTIVNFRGSLTALQRILFDLERGTPALFVDDILIQLRHTNARANMRAQRAQALGQTVDPSFAATAELDVRLSVSGYMRESPGAREHGT